MKERRDYRMYAVQSIQFPFGYFCALFWQNAHAYVSSDDNLYFARTFAELKAIQIV